MSESPGRVAIVGAGVIGASWAALFAAHGWRTTVHDVAPGAESRLRDAVARALPALASSRPDAPDPAATAAAISFEPDLARALDGADAVQECGPDRVSFKRALWPRIERHAPPDALLLSSSSGIPTRLQAARMRRPGRLLIGHPFNPPHLMPLVEVVAHREGDPADVARALALYRGLGRRPVPLAREMPGFVANRLQAALLREAMLLVRRGVVTTAELDEIVTGSIGLRWAATGPFLAAHLGGGPGGIEAYLAQFATGLRLLWLQSKLLPVHLGRNLRATLARQVRAGAADRPIAALEQQRDSVQAAILAARGAPPIS